MNQASGAPRSEAVRNSLRRRRNLIGAACALAWSAAMATGAGAAIDADIGSAALDIDPLVSSARVADLVLANRDDMAPAIIYRATNANPRLTLSAVAEAMLMIGVDPGLVVSASSEAQPEMAGEAVFAVASALGLTTGAEGDGRDMALSEQIVSAAISGLKSRAAGPEGLQITVGDVRIQIASVAAELTPFLSDDQRLPFLTFVIFEANIAGYTLAELNNSIITFSTSVTDEEGAVGLLNTTTITPTNIGSSSK